MKLPQKADLMPWMARVISSPTTRHCRQAVFRWKAQLKGEGTVVDVFINPRDPFSFVLLQALPNLTNRFDIQLCFRTVWHQPADMFPEPAMWADWAIPDAARLADLYGLEPPGLHSAPTEATLIACRDYLLGLERAGSYLAQASAIMGTLWQTGKPGAIEEGAPTTPELEERLGSNEQHLIRLGHYQGSMLHFRGEWFWGVPSFRYGTVSCWGQDRLWVIEGKIAKEMKPHE